MSDRSRKAPTAIRTTDVSRPRVLALAALGGLLGAGITLAAEQSPLKSERPIARPHAKLACTTCHTTGETNVPPAASACKTCHGASHASTRAAHRALAAKGTLTCMTCHGQHTGAQGITFTNDAVIRWGASSEVVAPPPRLSGVQPGAIASGTTVPLVPLKACSQCHDPTRAADPIAACVPAGRPDAGVPTSQCFDEHTKLEPPPRDPSKTVCEKQHGPNRYVAWDAAREIAATTPWVGPKKKEGTPWVPVGGALATALAFAGIATRRRRPEQKKAATQQVVVPAERRRLPTINTSTCLGCYACVDACPFDVLQIEKYVAVVARPEECCGVVLCEQVCPNGSLQITDGEPILDRPATDDELESRDVPGLFLAGDLTGLPLIKNAINQGARVIDRIAATLPKKRTSEADVNVIIIGAGPAGISAALRAKEKELTSIVLEQATIAASIKSFPRDKIVHDPPLDLPIVGELWMKQSTKEELLAQWTRIVRSRGLEVKEGRRVVEIAKEGDMFVVTTESESGQQERFRAARVVLAIGRRGTPRKLEPLEVEPGADDRIAYALADARSFEGKRVVVVGLGDSAMEAALALSRQPGTTVTMSYRGKDFARGKAKNIAEVKSQVAKGRLKLLFETQPIKLTKTGVTMEGKTGRLHIGADAMFVLIGGVPSWGLLEKAGIRRPNTEKSSV